MADRVPTQQRLMRERSKALAYILLTDIPGVALRDSSADEIGVDYVVHQRRPGGLRQLGVELRYVWSAQSASSATAIIRSTLAGHRSDFVPFPFPVVLFYFTMQDNGAWYTWVAEPVIQDARPVLAMPDADCRRLDDNAVREVFDRVNAWYDVYYSAVSAPAAS